MGSLFGGAPSGGGQQQAPTAPAAPTPLQAIQHTGSGFGPNSQAAGITYGDPASVLGSQSMAINPGLGSLDEYIAAAQQFLQGGAGGGADPRAGSAISGNLGQ